MGGIFRQAGDKAKVADVLARKNAGTPLTGLVVVTITLLCVYATFRGATILNPGYRWVDYIFAFMLLGAETFTLFQGVGYLFTVLRAVGKYGKATERVFALSREPSVAVVVASFNEEPSVLEDTIATVTTLDYANKRVYLLDDSTRENLQKGIQALAEKYGCTYVHRINRRGYKAGAINDLLKTIQEKYLAIFDADQKPVFSFLREIIPLLEEDERIAFVQTPQFYANVDQSPVARGASYQQAVFYEYICEGKSTSNAMFCCGTNVVLRTEALRGIGGFDETSVTEDFATSLLLHSKGWKSLYYNRVFVYGLGPETLAGYFTQQMRWAMGNIGVMKRMVSMFLRQPRTMRSAQWWDYCLSGSYYFVGWANLAFLLSPVTYILFGVRPLIADPLLYLAAFVPYFVVSLYAYYLSMGMRGYRLAGLYIGQAIGFISFWVYITASVVAMLGKRRAFGVTPKGATGKLPIKYLTPQLTMLVLSLAAIATGIYRAISTMDWTMLVNVFWAAYHSVLLGMIFYFNRPFPGYSDNRIFRDSVMP